MQVSQEAKGQGKGIVLNVARNAQGYFWESPKKTQVRAGNPSPPTSAGQQSWYQASEQAH